MTVSTNFYANYLISSVEYSNSRIIALEDSYLHVNEIICLSLIQRFVYELHQNYITISPQTSTLPFGGGWIVVAFVYHPSACPNIYSISTMRNKDNIFVYCTIDRCQFVSTYIKIILPCLSLFPSLSLSLSLACSLSWVNHLFWSKHNNFYIALYKY